MKKHLLLISSVLMFTVLIIGCSSKVDTSVTFNNISASHIMVNFRGSIVEVPSGKVVVLKAIPEGTFAYATTYSIPPGMTGTAQGDVSGSITIGVATKVQILYSSFINESSYTLSATKSNSDDQNASTTTGP